MVALGTDGTGVCMVGVYTLHMSLGWRHKRYMIYEVFWLNWLEMDGLKELRDSYSPLHPMIWRLCLVNWRLSVFFRSTCLFGRSIDIDRCCEGFGQTMIFRDIIRVLSTLDCI